MAKVYKLNCDPNKLNCDPNIAAQNTVLCHNVTQARLESDLDILFYIIIILLTNIVHTDHKVSILCSNTHHFKIARCNNQVVNNIVDLCDQGQDGGLRAQQDRERRVSVSDHE